jgi:hypothetical protein
MQLMVAIDVTAIVCGCAVLFDRTHGLGQIMWKDQPFSSWTSPHVQNTAGTLFFAT